MTRSIILCLLLTACSTPAPSPAPLVERTCAHIMTVTPDQRSALEDALARLPGDDIVSLVVREWQGLRDQARACQG